MIVGYAHFLGLVVAGMSAFTVTLFTVAWAANGCAASGDRISRDRSAS
jgi:hypothetical protein